jgi:predicted PurR-regulated permease PerM
MRKPTLKKMINGIFTSFITGACISFPCHKTIAFCEQMKLNQLLSVTLGVIAANIVKTPIIFNYKRVQIGMKMINKIPFSNVSQVVKLNLLEDIIEESAKYTMAKYKMQNKEHNTFIRNFGESILLFALCYPLDIFKNKKIYGINILKANKNDFLTKALHKNVQNILFFRMLKNA